MSPTIASRVYQVRSSIPEHVQIVGISKGVPASKIREAYAAGIRHFGENRIQEAEAKRAELADLTEACWHFIGHLQANKVRKAIQLFDWLDSIDSLKLLQRVNRIAAEESRLPRVCLQVKPAPDPTKYGWLEQDLMAALPAIAQCTNLSVEGVMTILPAGLDSDAALTLFEHVATIKSRIQQCESARLRLPVLSMGMSNDYLLAIQAGSNQVRIGRFIFA